MPRKPKGKKKGRMSKGKTATKSDVVKIVRKQLKSVQEMKQHTVGLATTDVYSGTAAVRQYDLTAIAQGVLDTQRDGDEIYLKHIKIRLFVCNQETVTSNDYVNWRVFVFQYMDNPLSGATQNPNIANFLLTSNANGGTYGAFSSRNQDHFSSYHVLYDKFFRTVLGGKANSPGDNPAYATSFVINVPLKYAKRKVEYVAGSVNGPNHIWMLITTGQADVGAANNPFFLFDATVSFTDS